MKQYVEQAVERYAEECFDEQKALLKNLGVIPAPSHQEDLRAVFCRDWFIAQGANDVSIDFAKNVICKINCENADEYIVFAAHMDVVFPDTTELPMHEVDGRLFAPGIGDDTANLVNLMMSAKFLIQNHIQTKCGILIVANACEEGLGNLDGTKALFSEYGTQIKAFYSFDCYLSLCCSSAVGSYRYKISCHTCGGHSYANFGAPNAIEILCSLVETLYRIEPPTEAHTTYNVGRIEGGTTVNSIAEDASMLYEFRSTSQNCLETMEKMLHKALDSVQDRGGDIRVDLLGIRPGNGPVDKDELAAYTKNTAEIISKYYDGEIDYSPNSTDSNVPLSIGIPANTVGTVLGAGAHTREEWIDIESLKPGLKIALSLILQYAI